MKHRQFTHKVMSERIRMDLIQSIKVSSDNFRGGGKKRRRQKFSCLAFIDYSTFLLKHVINIAIYCNIKMQKSLITMRQTKQERIKYFLSEEKQESDVLPPKQENL